MPPKHYLYCADAAALNLWQGRERHWLLQRELQLRFGGDLNLLAFLYDRADAAGDGADGRAHSRISSDGADRCAQSRASEQAECRAVAGAFTFGVKSRGDDGIGIPADHELRQLED